MNNESFLTNNLIIAREGDDVLFTGRDEKVFCRLDRYAILPLEQYEELKALAAAPTPPVQGIGPCVEPYKSHQCLDCGSAIEQTQPAQQPGSSSTEAIMNEIAEHRPANPDSPFTILIDQTILRQILDKYQAQEAEPVAYIDKRGDFWSIDRAKAELEDGNLLDLRPVYTHAPSDKLRQAWAEALRIAEGRNHDGNKVDMIRKVLRAAVEGKS